MQFFEVYKLSFEIWLFDSKKNTPLLYIFFQKIILLQILNSWQTQTNDIIKLQFAYIAIIPPFHKIVTIYKHICLYSQHLIIIMIILIHIHVSLICFLFPLFFSFVFKYFSLFSSKNWVKQYQISANKLYAFLFMSTEIKVLYSIWDFILILDMLTLSS